MKPIAVWGRRRDTGKNDDENAGRDQVRRPRTRDIKNIAAHALAKDRKERAKHTFAKLPKIRAEEQQPTLNTHNCSDRSLTLKNVSDGAPSRCRSSCEWLGPTLLVINFVFWVCA